MIYVNDRTIKPQLAPKGKSFEEWVTISSPAFQRRAVGRLQRFMAQETGYRYEALDHLSCWRDTFEVLSITSEIIGNGREPEIREAMVGFVWFTFDYDVPTLYNCYLHPSYRGENDQRNLINGSGLVDSERSLSSIQNRRPNFWIIQSVSVKKDVRRHKPRCEFRKHSSFALPALKSIKLEFIILDSTSPDRRSSCCVEIQTRSKLNQTTA